jgi:hypothetical protein
VEPPNDLALPVNIRLGRKSLTVTNAQTFYNTKLITIEKSLMLRPEEGLQDLILARKYETRVEVTDSDKHFRFQWLGINYALKKFYKTVTEWNPLMT